MRNHYTQEEFINNSKLKYNDTFDYSKVNYKTYSKDKIEIRCIKHNIICNVYPINHINQVNGGCYECEKNNNKNIVKKLTVPKKIDLNENEIIKDIPLLEYNNYCITNTGRCFSKRTNKELSKYINGGYYRVHFRDNKHNKNKQYTIHYLVYISFKNDYDDTKIIDHIDGNKLNNNVINLRCISQSDNVINAYNNNKKMYQQNIIQAFDKKNNLIKEFDNINDAKIFINHKNTTSISNCLRGIYKTSGNYIWKFQDKSINENKTNNYVDNIDNYKTIGIINDNDYSNYLINKQGIIINTKYNNRKIKIFTNEQNYQCIYLFNSDVKKMSYLLHRLLGKYFLENGDYYYYNNYVINHKDKNRNNNNIENLEWITQKENTIHGCGRKIAKIDIKTDNIIKVFNTITEAYKELNKPWNSLISKVCNEKDKRKTIYGFKWKYINE